LHFYSLWNITYTLSQSFLHFTNHEQQCCTRFFLNIEKTGIKTSQVFVSKWWVEAVLYKNPLKSVFRIPPLRCETLYELHFLALFVRLSYKLYSISSRKNTARYFAMCIIEDVFDITDMLNTSIATLNQHSYSNTAVWFSKGAKQRKGVLTQ